MTIVSLLYDINHILTSLINNPLLLYNLRP